jgi:hypothetical protein
VYGEKGHTCNEKYGPFLNHKSLVHEIQPCGSRVVFVIHQFCHYFRLLEQVAVRKYIRSNDKRTSQQEQAKVL